MERTRKKFDVVRSTGPGKGKKDAPSFRGFDQHSICRDLFVSAVRCDCEQLEVILRSVPSATRPSSQTLRKLYVHPNPRFSSESLVYAALLDNASGRCAL